jgi:putative thymidine phosphorylase
MYYLKPQKIDIKVSNKYICLLNEFTAHHLDLHAGDRVYIKNGKEEVIAILDISSQTKDGEIGLYVESWDKLKVKKEDRRVSVEIARKPDSILYIREKLDGKKLDAFKINKIIKHIVNERLSDVEITYFVSGCYINGLDDEETVNLTKAIVNNGGRLRFKNKIIVDKHCIGGVPGNRTTLITVPICAVAGLLVPKTSSRAITSPAGTADTMEVLANVTNDSKKLTKIANKVGAFISWGGGVDLAAADDHMIKIRNPMSLDPQGMLLASILAKKHSVSATHVVIDIPYGPDVKVKNPKEAEPLKKRFEKIGAMLGMKIKVVLTDGSQPIGNGIGPILECIDVMKVLKNAPDAPRDLRKKSLFIAGTALELTGKALPGKGAKMAEEILKSGKAHKKLLEIISAQGKKNIPLTAGKFTANIKAKNSGKVLYINNKMISHYARLAGAPINMGAGIFIHKFKGDKINKGDTLFTLYSENKSRLENTLSVIKVDDVYKIK